MQLVKMESLEGLVLLELLVLLALSEVKDIMAGIYITSIASSYPTMIIQGFLGG